MNDLDRYIIARYMYSIGEEDKFLNDSEYRTLEEGIKEKYPDNEYVIRSWSDDPCPVELLKENGMEEFIQKVKLLHKSESIPSINAEADLEVKLGHYNEEGRLSFKDDGFNTSANYYNRELVSVNLRGRALEGFIDVDCVKEIIPKTIPVSGKVRITGELVIPDDKWKLYQLETGNKSQRSSVSTALSRGDSKYLHFDAFKIESDVNTFEDSYATLTSWGFNTPGFINVKNYRSLIKAIDVMSRRNETYNRPTDGLVLESKNTQVAIRLGAWRETLHMSYITAYEETRGMHGNSLNLLIKPVDVGDRSVSRVTVQNVANIVEGDLRIGSQVAFNMRSGAIGVYNSMDTEKARSMYPDEKEFIEMIDSMM